MNKCVEYQVKTRDGNIDIINWHKAKELVANHHNTDIVRIERVTRYEDDISEYETLLDLEKVEE